METTDRAPSHESPAQTRIALVSDTHTNFGSVGDQPLYRERLATVIAEVNAAGVDVVVVAGDLSEHGADDEFAEFQRQVQGFSAPVLVVPGNHDVGGKCLPDAPGPVTPERVQKFEDRFGPSFWRKDIAGVRLLGLNSLILGGGFDRETEQWAFLKAELESPVAAPTVVILHQPPFLERTDEPGGDYWNVEPVPRARLLGLLAQGGVRAVLSGHIHRPLRHEQGGISFITTPPVSFGLPPKVQPEGWTLVTIPLKEMKGGITAEIQTL